MKFTGWTRDDKESGEGLSARNNRRQPKNTASVSADQKTVVSNSFILERTAQQVLGEMADKHPETCGSCK